MSTSTRAKKHAREDSSSSAHPDEDLDKSIKDDEKWTQGDFQIITSDNIRFRVPSYYLFSNSAVFRDLHSLDPQAVKKVTFTDDTFETSTVFRHFLCLVVDGECVLRARPPIVNLAHFILKWDCKLARLSLLAHLGENVSRLNWGKASPLTVFVAGALLDSLETCLWALDQPARVWGVGDTTEVGAPHKNVLNPTYWPLILFKQVPLNYSWALQCAFNEWDGDYNHSNDINCIETEDDYDDDGEAIGDPTFCNCGDDLGCLFVLHLRKAQEHC